MLLDGPRVSQTVWTLLYSRRGIESLPPVIAAMGAGDDTLLATVVAQSSPPDVTGLEQAVGMQRVVWCHDIAAQATPEDLRAAAARVSPAAGTLFQAAGPTGGLLGPTVADTCRDYGLTGGPHEPVPAGPVTSDVPTLVQTGQFDPSTPPEFGELAARSLRTAHVVEVPGFGHSALITLPGCGPAIVAEFLADPTARPDTTCLDGFPSPFAPR